MMSPEEAQRQEMQRWRLLPKWRNLQIFDRLLANEFENYEQRQQRIHLRLARLMAFCRQHVPYYESLIPELGSKAEEREALEVLSELPVMDRAGLQSSYDELTARQLPEGEQVAGLTKTSGSTGQPVKVLHTLNSLRFFSFLKQREYRWWGMNPMGRLAIVRGFEDLPLVDGEPLKPGVPLSLPGWPSISNFFETGPAVAMSDVSDMGEIAGWLVDYQPDTLLGMAAVLECVALEGRANLPKIDRVLSISQQLPRPMERLIAENMQASVHENYGFNEVGLVASRCPVSDRFHVHVEHALVEILREDDTPCALGESGRLVVTALNNPVMPLLRYDTGDYARKLGHDCECGRTLPSFDQLFGRYRRLAHLPKNTWSYWDSVLQAIADAEPELVVDLRQYQLRQKSAHDYELRLVTQSRLPKALIQAIVFNWEAVEPSESVKLNIMEVDVIERTGKKVQDFISDLAP